MEIKIDSGEESQQREWGRREHIEKVMDETWVIEDKGRAGESKQGMDTNGRVEGEWREAILDKQGRADWSKYEGKNNVEGKTVNAG